MPFYVSLRRSTREEKKYMVGIKYQGSERTVHFGQAGADDYTTHAEMERDERKRLYIIRHEDNEKWGIGGVYTAGFWARWLLWNKPTIKASIADIENRFNIKISV